MRRGIAASRGSRSELVRYAIKRAERNDVPPLFETAATTKVLALMSRVGPVSRKDLDRMRPGIHVRRAIRGLKPYIDAGLIVTFRIQGLRRQPRLWALNQRHKGAVIFATVLRAIWWRYLGRRLKTRYAQAYRVPFALRVPATKAPTVYRKAGFRDYGDILHLLAEFQAPVSQSVLTALLGAIPSTVYRRVSVLIAHGLVRESYCNGERMFMLNRGHPVVPPLRTWLRYVNRHGDVRFNALGKQFRTMRRQHTSAEWSYAKGRARGAKTQEKRHRQPLYERIRPLIRNSMSTA